MSTNHPFNKLQFLKSVADLSQLPPAGKEVAFIGRSNAGKSSALNALSGQKKLVRTSKTPGRTQEINFFKLTAEKYLVDLPGYGYAKVSAEIQENWMQLVNGYLSSRAGLIGLVLVMDIRHPLKSLDHTLLDWAVSISLPVHILLTKADKLTRNQAQKTLFQVKQLLINQADLFTVHLFSAHSKQGVETVQQAILQWLN